MLIILANGVRVVSIPTESKTVSVGVFVNAGSANELPHENGISHFLEHMAFKGTKRRTYSRISSDAERFGAEMNAFTDRDMTAYFISGLPEHAMTFADILGDIFCNSTFDAVELEKEREVILQEYRMYVDRAGHVAHDSAYMTAYKNQAFGRRIIGEPKNIKAFQRQDFLNYVDRWYRGSNVVVGVAGSFDEDKVLAKIEAAFSKVKPTDWRASGRDVPEFAPGMKIIKKPAEQCHVQMMYEAVSDKDPLHRAYQVAAAVLGEGMSSPLFDEVREKRGLVYSVSSDVDIRDSSGVFCVNAGTTADKLESFFDAVEFVMLNHTSKIKSIDMERATNTLCVQTACQMERPFNRIYSAAAELFSHNQTFTVEEELAQIRAVTPAQVKKVINRLVTSRPVVAVAGNKINPDHLSQFK